MNNMSLSRKQDDEIIEFNVALILKLFWKEKFQIFLITSFFAIYSVYYALSIPNQYKATVVLAPAQQNNSMMSTLSRLSGLASMAGINVGKSNTNETDKALEIMKSWSFIEEFVVSNSLSSLLFAVNGWDQNENKLLYDQEKFDAETQKWLPGVIKPNSWSLYRSFSSKIEINEDKLTGLISVSLEYYSPYMAKEILDDYISAINSYMQNRELEKVTRSINYLQDQINNTSIAEMRDVFYDVIGEQIKNKMLAEATLDYAFTPVNPSMVPEIKSKPKRAAICVLWTLMGGFISLLIILLKHYWMIFRNK